VNKTRIAFWIASLVGAACAPTELRTGPGTSCEAQPDAHCAHPIDHALVPLLRERGLPIREAAPVEVCRRLSIDLLDRIPTVDEMVACIARAPAERVDAFMDTEAYARAQGRRWAARIGYDDFTAWWQHMVELDALVRRLASGQLTYPDFIGDLVVHPGFFALHYEDDWAKTLLRLSFNRDARQDEIDTLRPLTYGWEGISFCDGASYWVRTTLWGKDAGEPDGEYCDTFMPTLVGCNCEGGACVTTAFGRDLDFGVTPCIAPEDYTTTVNHFRASAASPDGADQTCPDGSTQLECADRLLDDETYETFGPVPAVAEIDAAARDRLRELGRALASQRDFWEAAADRELEALLGWWQSGFKQPEWDIPAVRSAVADELQRTGSVRAAQRLILTSLLYTAPAAAPAEGGVAPPPWATGPMKLLAGEAWLDSVSQLVGETVGRCDYRFLTTDDLDGLVNPDPAVVDAVPGTLGGAFMGDELGALGDAFTSAEGYRAIAEGLGGCTNQKLRPRRSSVGIVAAQRTTAQRLCANGRGVVAPVPDDSDASLDLISEDLVRRALSRNTKDAELAALRAEMRACLARGPEQGCADITAAGRWACQRIVDSAEFAIY
jgi:hypothetical protein